MKIIIIILIMMFLPSNTLSVYANEEIDNIEILDKYFEVYDFSETDGIIN